MNTGLILRIIKIIPRYLADSFVILWNRFLCIFSKRGKKYRGAWLICERGIEARDNGFAFFRFIRKEHPEINAYYLIDAKQTIDYERVKDLGNVIAYNSKEHKLALFYAKFIISTHIGFITPWSYVCHKTFFRWTGCPKFVLLNHGITKEDMSDKMNKFVTGIDLFITANKLDYDMIVSDKRYGYKPDEVAMTGYARYDNWKDESAGKKMILFMPTWRWYLVNRTLETRNLPTVKDEFTDSLYYNKIQTFLNNKRLNDILTKTSTTLIFYPHYEMQSAMHLWTTKCKNIQFADKQHYLIPDLLKRCNMLITDYSGVGFDFAYMYKPLIYYQFDQSEYYKYHYQKSDKYTMETEGLGAVVKDEDILIDKIEESINNNFNLEDIYKQRINDFFTYHDQNNCQRIYNAIISTFGK